MTAIVNNAIDDRLSASLAWAAKLTKALPKSKRLSPSRASKIRKDWLVAQKFQPTATVRIHKDVVTLAKRIWPNRHDRVRACSEAIRLFAEQSLPAKSPLNPPENELT